MNILHLRSSGGMFGAEGVILNLSRELKELGIHSHIICFKNAQDGHEELVEEAHKLDLSAESFVCAGKLDFKAITYIRNIIKEKNIDIVHCHDYKVDFLGFLAALFLNVKLITTNHLWTSETTALRIYEFCDALLMNVFDKVVGVSDAISKQVCQFNLFKSKVVTIYNGIDLTKYDIHSKHANHNFKKTLGIPEQDVIVGAVGRLSVQKGYTYLLEAVKQVLQEFPHMTLVFVGDGVLRESLEKKVKELGIEKKVVFAGIQKDMVNIYRNIDVFVMSSIDEGLPLVLLEALAMQKPAIVTDVGAIAKVVKHNKTGLLLESRNVGALKGAMLELLNNKEKAQELACNGRKLIEKNFSSKSMARQYKEVYKGFL